MVEFDEMDWSDRTVGVTGGGGFIGLRFIERALELGAEARALEADAEAASRAREAGAEVVVGDTRRRGDAEALCEGCDLVVHTAAIVGEGGSFERYRSVNVDGTETVVRAAAEGSVDRFVHLSSVMVYGFDFPPEVDEEGPLRGEGNPYCQTKIESERVAESYHGDDLEVTVVRPGDVYGPGSKPWIVRPLELMKNYLFVLPNGGEGVLDPTYIDNLVDAIALLADRGESGTFNATDGEAVPARVFFQYHADMLGRSWIPTAPASLLEWMFAAVAAGFRVVGAEPPATPEAIHFLNKPHGYSNEKLLSIGHEPRVSLDEGMRRTEQWAHETGLLD